jgi:glycosidase
MENLIIYQIFPDRFYKSGKNDYNKNLRPWDQKPSRSSFFGGNLKGIIEKMDYLIDLGINALYLTPIFKSPSTHKYDTEDYFQIDPGFGNMDDFELLLKYAHKNGIKVFLDGVFNHTGIRFFAFEDIRQKGEQSKYYNWYKIHQTPLKLKPKPSYEDAGIYYIPKLNHDFPEVIDYLKKIIRYWTNKGIDGWRFDMPWCMPPEVVNALINEAKSINHSITVIGETWEQPDQLLKDYHFDGTMDYIVRNSVINLLNQKISLKEFQQTLDYKTNKSKSQNWNMLGSHDTKRIRGALNRNLNKVLIAQAIQFFLPGHPVIYYGDEIGLYGVKDPDCRRPFKWDKEEWNETIYENVKSLINLRNRLGDLFKEGSCHFLQNKNGVAFKRQFKQKTISLKIDMKQLTYTF